MTCLYVLYVPVYVLKNNRDIYSVYLYKGQYVTLKGLYYQTTI